MQRLALVGVSHVHMNDFITELQHRHDVEVCAVWDPAPALAASVAQKLGCNVAPTRESIWNDPSIQAVVIASETSLHNVLVPEAAAAGKSMFVEKPLGIDAAETTALAETVKKAGVMFHTGFFLRDLPAIQSIKSLFERGKSGTIKDTYISYSHPGLARGWLNGSWLRGQTKAGGGALLDLGLHCADLIEYMTGTSIEDVQASIGRVPNVETDVGDHFAHVNVVLNELKCETRFYVGWADDPVLPPRPDPKGARLVVRMEGSEGYAVFSDTEAFFADIDMRQTLELDRRQPDAADGLRTFLEAVLHKKHEHLASPESAARASQIIALAYRSASVGPITNLKNSAHPHTKPEFKIR